MQVRELMAFSLLCLRTDATLRRLRQLQPATVAQADVHSIYVWQHRQQARLLTTIIVELIVSHLLGESMAGV